MKNEKMFLALILFLTTGLSVFIFLGFREPKTDQGDSLQVCFQEHCFSVELAQTPAERASGLMFREALDFYSGMLFIFDKEDTHSFWMKNTLIPLDIIWLNSNKQVVFINKNTQPCNVANCPSIQPQGLASYVLELNAGVVDEIDLAVGDTLIFND